MGAWGYEPFDNDEAGDWLAAVSVDVSRKILKALRQWKAAPSTAIAAAGLALHMSESRGLIHWNDEDLLIRARHTVALISETDYAAPWNDPAYMRRELNRLAINLTGAIDCIHNIKAKLRIRRIRKPRKKAA